MQFVWTSSCVVLFGAVAASAFGASSIGSLGLTSSSQSAGHSFFGQSFIVPAGETGLQSATLAAWQTSAGSRNGTLELWRFSDDGTNGSFLAPVASASFSLPSGTNQFISAALNATVTPGDKYAVYVNWGTPLGTAGGYYQSNYYPDGSTFFESQSTPLMFTSLDQVFQVQFGLIPEPASMLTVAGIPLFLKRRRG
jgi:hypothetical protein